VGQTFWYWFSLKWSILTAAHAYPVNEINRQSMTSLMTEIARAPQAKRRFLKRIRKAPDRSTREKVSWT
jgi:hypothetical protein